MAEHLYLHYPYCAKICPYCAFYVLRGGVQEQLAVARALAWELDTARRELGIEEVTTIYFGGGTPSLMPLEGWRQVCAALPKLTDGGEFTLEVNPATVTKEKATAWHAAGVNRISLGAQSFHLEELKMLGRQHEPADVAETCDLLRKEGFTNINIDLIYGLPGQTVAGWRANVEGALRCLPVHVSAYGLTYEEDTDFFERLQNGEYHTDEAVEIEMFYLTRDLLAQAGIFDYEISNFAKPGYESTHNRAYWMGKDYVGIGPSAVSTIGPKRWKNIPDGAEYVRLSGQTDGWRQLRREEEELSEDVRARERLMFGLRMREGIEMPLNFEKRFTRLAAEGLMELFSESGQQRVRLTRKGQVVADSVAAELL